MSAGRGGDGSPGNDRLVLFLPDGICVYTVRASLIPFPPRSLHKMKKLSALAAGALLLIASASVSTIAPLRDQILSRGLYGDTR